MRPLNLHIDDGGIKLHHPHSTVVTNAMDFHHQDCPNWRGNDGAVVREAMVGGQQCFGAIDENMAKNGPIQWFR